MAVILENDSSVTKWLKPAKGDFRIYSGHDDESIRQYVEAIEQSRMPSLEPTQFGSSQKCDLTAASTGTRVVQ